MGYREAAIVGMLLAAVTAGSAAPMVVNPPFPRIANCYSVGLTPWSTEQDLVEVARFDLLIGGLWADWSHAEQRAKLAANMAAVRKLNPHIIILDFSSSAPYADPNDPTFPANGWLLQPNGQRVKGWPGTEMINLTQPEVIAWLTGRSVASVRERGFDGSFIDCMGSGFDWWACNIAHGEPYEIDADGDGKADSREWLDAQWVRAKTELSRQVRAALGPDVPLMANQAGDWGRPCMNGILLEDYLDYVLDGRQQWDWAMGEYLRWCSAPLRPNVTTIVSSSGIEPPYDPWRTLDEAGRQALLDRGYSLKQRMRFGLATTLMGDGYFAYDLHTRWRGQRWWYPEYDAPLGYPKGPGQAQHDGSWRREFDGGTAIVNPTLFDVRVSLAARHRDYSSGQVASEFVVPAQDGRLFCPTDEPERAGDLPDPTPAFAMDGPEPLVRRGDRLLVRRESYVAMFDERGEMLLMTDRKHTIAQNLRPFIVSDDKWRDFAYADTVCEVLASGDLEFTGKRVNGAAMLQYHERAHLDDTSLTLSYQWEALSAGHVHMWRHQVDFPLAEYGGGRYESAIGSGMLPSARVERPVLVQGVRQVAVQARRGFGVRAETALDSALVDERHYGVATYRLGCRPMQGDMRAGQTWTVRVRLTVGG